MKEQELIQIHNQNFRKYIDHAEINNRIRSLAERLSVELKDKDPLVIVVLNGAFAFATELIKNLSFDCEITFIKIKSYEGLKRGDESKMMIGLDQQIKGRNIVIIEDIIDSGATITDILSLLRTKQPQSIRVATLLFKPEAMQYDYQPDHSCFEVENKFLVGFGLDYDGYGRGYQDLYVINEEY